MPAGEGKRVVLGCSQLEDILKAQVCFFLCSKPRVELTEMSKEEKPLSDFSTGRIENPAGSVRM